MDEAVLRRLLSHVGAVPGRFYGKAGKAHLQERIKGYNQAARFTPFVVLIDLNEDADCAPLLKESWISSPSPRMCFRVAVRAVEAWFFADDDRLAGFLSVPRSKIPSLPEQLEDPKRTMVELASRSRKRDIREDMVPRPGSGRKEGPAYVSRLIEFAHGSWRPDVAASRSDSLRRCLTRLRGIAKR